MFDRNPTEVGHSCGSPRTFTAYDEPVKLATMREAKRSRNGMMCTRLVLKADSTHVE